jgi:hypothetical protein
MESLSFTRRHRERFLRWWRAPIRIGDRILGSVIGAFACFWIALLGSSAVFGPLAGSALVWWLLTGVALGVVLGAVFPKAVAVVLFPLSTFGSGPG